jgi:uncharacterized protein (UPF0147 family)
MGAAGLTRELGTIAKNIKVFTGKNNLTREILKNMGLTLEDIHDDVRDLVNEAANFLTDKGLPERERVSKGEKILSQLLEDEGIPAKIREMIIATALERLEAVKASLKNPRQKVVAGVMTLHPTLNLLIYRDEKTLKQLRKFGVAEVPEVIRDAARKAKEVLEDESLVEEERARIAADMLAELLQPGYFRGRDVPEVPHELKLVLWEIAYGLGRAC